MEMAYAFAISTNKEKADILRDHFIFSLRKNYEKLKGSCKWRSNGFTQREGGMIHNLLYIPESGCLNVHFDKGGISRSMIFSAVEKIAIKDMVRDIGIKKIDDKCIRKGLTNYGEN